MNPELPRWKRILRGLGYFLVLAAVFLYLVFPAGMGLFALWPARAEVGPPPPGFEPVALVAPDGVELQAWYRPPDNGTAILLLHGAGDSRAGVRPYAELLARHGYGVLALDQRGHGQSGGRTNRLGWQGTLDVGAAVEFLQGRPEVRAIGGLGLSMGGEVLLGAASAYPAITAIAVDGATRRSLEELFALESERPLVRSFTARVMLASVRLFSGQAPPLPLLDSMLAAPGTRFLLIAAGAEADEVAFNTLFAERLSGAASGEAALWVAPQAGHLQALSLYPAEYEQRLVEFFESLIGGD